jgi:hypothetical protein
MVRHEAVAAQRKREPPARSPKNRRQDAEFSLIEWPPSAQQIRRHQKESRMNFPAA